uniref:Uncharacterized protein n=1 Tax=Anguilla anguilla TaxID=7936 RepID=A0A0E9UUA1_ANGAN
MLFRPGREVTTHLPLLVQQY